MKKEIIFTEKAPTPVGPYSQAAKVGNTLYVSGQIPINPTSGKIITDDIAQATQQVMENIRAILKAAGMDFSNVVKCSIFVTDINDFSTVNDVYQKYFDADPPARETIEVNKLPKMADVEISCIAVD